MSVPACPMCGHNRNASAKRGEENLFICSVHGLYDGNPNEGGDYADHRPDIRIEREERAQQRQRERAHDRFRRR